MNWKAALAWTIPSTIIATFVVIVGGNILVAILAGVASVVLANLIAYGNPLKTPWSMILLLLLLPSRSPAQETFTPESIDKSVLNMLGDVADSATIEHVFCLLAVPDGSVDSLGRKGGIISVFVEPPQSGTPGRITFADCPFGTIIQWHNHILTETLKALTALDITPPADVKGAWRGCVLSINDYDEALRVTAPVTMIQVNTNVMCWWTKSEVRSLPRTLVNWPSHKATIMALP